MVRSDSTRRRDADQRLFDGNNLPRPEGMMIDLIAPACMERKLQRDTTIPTEAIVASSWRARLVAFLLCARERTRGKRIATCVAVLCIGLLASETASWSAYWILTGTPLSFAHVHAEQRTIIGEGAIDTGVISGTGDGKMGHLIPHPYLGYTRTKDDPYRVAGQEYVLGNRPLITDPPDDTIVVGIFGGSFAEQFSQTGSGALAKALSTDPRFAGKRFAFVTAALAGYKQPQQLLALNYLLSLGQHFDLVINIDGFNEIAGPTTANMPNHVSPYFPSGWYHLADRMPDMGVLERVGEVAFAKSERRSLASTMLSSSLLSRSATAQFLWKGRDGMLATRVADAQRTLMQEPPAEASEDMLGLPYEYSNDAALLADLVEQWKQSSLLMNALASAHDIPYMHFLQPNQYVPGTKTFSSEERKIAVNPGSPYSPWVAQGYPLLRQAGEELRSQGVAFGDLTNVFRGINRTVYRDDCCHINAEGNAYIGSTVGTAVIAALENGSRNGAFAAAR